MRDPYLYEDVPVLKNKLNIKEQELLDSAEADYGRFIHLEKEILELLLPFVVSLSMIMDSPSIENCLRRIQGTSVRLLWLTMHIFQMEVTQE